MNQEFQTALFGLRLLFSEQSPQNEGNESQEEIDAQRGQRFSSSGPASFKGDILNDPECVWSEDVWQDEDTLDAEQRIRNQGDVLPAFWKNEYETMANKYWHKFYRRNTTNFYKDRHYLHVICKELLDKPSGATDFNHMLEVGCGVGNAVLPLLELNDRLFVHCIDFARSAIELLRSNPLIASTGNRLIADVCDVVRDDLPATVPLGRVDVVMCMFVLSALPPDSVALVLRKLASSLRPGGVLFIRDYGRYSPYQPPPLPPLYIIPLPPNINSTTHSINTPLSQPYQVRRSTIEVQKRVQTRRSLLCASGRDVCLLLRSGGTGDTGRVLEGGRSHGEKSR